MNKIVLWGIAIIVIVGGLYFFLYSKPSPALAPNTIITPETTMVQKIATSNPNTLINTIAAKTYTVSIINFSFNPSTLNINKGDTVVWTNNDGAPHQVIGDGISGQVMGKGESFSKTFNESGTVNYHCSIHPSMKGIITIK